MQYLSRAYNYYSGINPATLSGAIDVIVVEREGETNSQDTILSCSPFHVRFGKLQVLRAGEKKVSLTVNSEEVPFFMKVGEAGEAFFVVETEGDVPDELLTSPLLTATTAGPSGKTTEASSSGPKTSASASKEENLQDANMRLNEEKFGVKPDRSTAAPSAVQEEPDFLDLDSEPAASMTADDTTTTPRASNNALPPISTPAPAGNQGSASYPSPPPSPELKVTSSTSEQPSPHAPESVPSAPYGLGTSNAPNVAAPPLSTSPPLAGKVHHSLESSASALAHSVSPASFLSHATQMTQTLAKASEGHEQHLAHYVDGIKTRTKITNVINHLKGQGRLDKNDPHLPEEVRQALAAETEAEMEAEQGKAGSEGGDELLPQLSEGEGVAPDVLYNEDVVLDMAGYKQQELRPVSPAGSANGEGDAMTQADQAPARVGDSAKTVREESIEAVRFGRAQVHDGRGWTENEATAPQVIAFAEDLLAAATALEEHAAADRKDAEETQSLSETTLEEQTDELSLESTAEPSATETSSKRSRANTMYQPSLKPETSEDYSWEWGGFPRRAPSVEDANVPGFPSPSSPEDDAVPRTRTISLQNSAATPTPAPAHLHATLARALTLPPTSNQPPHFPHRIKSYPPADGLHSSDGELSIEGRLENHEEDPYKFTLDMTEGGSDEMSAGQPRRHHFELSLCGDEGFGDESRSALDGETFLENRVSFQRFIQEPELVDDKRLVIRYRDQYLTWHNASPALASLILYRKSLTPPTLASLPATPARDARAASAPPSEEPSDTAELKPSSSGSGWSRWWRRGESVPPPESPAKSSSDPPKMPAKEDMIQPPPTPASEQPEATTPILPSASPLSNESAVVTHYAKTLRLSSDQLKQLKLKKGANTITFSVTSSYSGVASCTARIFLWDASDHIVISDIDGTITKSDALGHVFAAIGRDWTHLGVAKLYTDIVNNGYKVMYLTSRAIGQADSTRDYLKGISQGNYQLPEGPVIMSPDRLMTSLHREVILRKPEVFKMACLRDIQRLFGGSRKAFYAGFGNRITDAMSYRSVNIPSSRIFTIDSNGEVKTELLELAGYKSSYIYMNDLVDQMFPPVHARWAPEYTDFNFWRATPIANIELPDLGPPSPTLSARSDTSGRLSVLRNFSLRGSRASSPVVSEANTHDKNESGSPRPSSPLVRPSWSSDSEMSEGEDLDGNNGERRRRSRANSMPGSLPGSMEDSFFDDPRFDLDHDGIKRDRRDGDEDVLEDDDNENGEGDGREDDAPLEEGDAEDDELLFEDDLDAAVEMSKISF